MASSIYFLPSNSIWTNQAIGSIILGMPGQGKACWDNENIITPQGKFKIKDIKVGDYIFGKNGKPTKVVGVFPQGKKQLYKITLSDNRSLICSGDHRFTVGRMSHGLEKWEVLTINDLLNNGIINNKNRCKYFIQNNDAIEYNKVEFEVDPYILGAFLGDGCKSNGNLVISSSTAEIPNKIAKLLSKRLNEEIKIDNNPANYSWIFYYKNIKRGNTRKLVLAKDLTNNEELIKLLTGTYSYDKYIPDMYKYCSIEQRYSLIQGLIDTGGFVGGILHKYGIGYGTSSKQLAEDITEVLRSFGNIFVKINSTLNYETNGYFYDVTIGCDDSRKENLVSLSNKLKLAKEAKQRTKQWNRHYDRLNIINIEKLDLIDNCTCFTVDAEDHQFIAGDTVVTHNTFFSVNVAANCIAMGQRIIALDPKDDFIKLQNIAKDVKVIDINNIIDGSLNPFTFLKDINSLTLLTIIELILGDLTREDKNAISFVLDDFITRIKKDNEYTDMQDLVDYLHSHRNDRAREIGKALKPAATSKYGRLLFTRERNVEPLYIDNKSSLVISILGMPLPPSTKKAHEYSSEERFTSAIVYIICKKLEEILATKSVIPTTIFIDEAHLLFGNAEMSNVIHKFLTMGRSLNIAMVLASQSASHFPDNISQFISNKFIFKSSIDDAEIFIDKYDTSKIDATKEIDRESVVIGITNLSTGQCFYIDSKSRSGFIKIVSNYDVSLLTSNPLTRKDRGTE